jgi:tRNA(fMet)-specific endonuclease VapC
MLGTDIIYAINRRDLRVLQALRSFSSGEVGVSSITYAELRFGVGKSAGVAENVGVLERFLLSLALLPFDAEAAREYGRVRHALQRFGQSISANDLLIAAHARALGVTLVTNNQRELGRVSGLHLESWVLPEP